MAEDLAKALRESLEREASRRSGGAPMAEHTDPTPERPVYAKERQDDTSATAFFMVTVDEGWRSSILCTGMYEWAADWLVEQLQGRPFAPGRAA